MTDADHEAWISRFWEQANASGQKIPFFLARHPRLAAQAIRHALRLSRLDTFLSDGPEGRLIARCLRRICIAKVFRLADTGACILDIPDQPGAFSLGSSKQTLRRKIRSAQKAGTSCRFVTDEAEQACLAGQLDAAFKVKSDLRYREQDSDHSHAIGVGLWTVADGADGKPLVVAVTPRDGEWAMLQIFVSLGETPEHSDARYLLTEAVVERLVGEGVRHLVDTRSPAELPNGLRHFQKMLGFHIARIRLRPAKSGGSLYPNRLAAPQSGPSAGFAPPRDAAGTSSSALTPSARSTIARSAIALLAL